MGGGPTLVEQLTQREHSILGRLANGLSAQQIAQELVLSLNTVKWYNRQIYSKLGVSNRSQAIVRSRQLGLLSADEAVPFREGRLLASLLPNAQFVALESKNHLLTRHETAWPTLVAAVRSFLK